MTGPSEHRVPTDLLTAAAIASVAYLLETALHEHLGHGVSCAALGGRLREIGAFYVDCDYRGMSDLGIRFVALAGPLVSLVTGVLGYAAVQRTRPTRPHLRLFLWLLGAIGLMTATGYLLFSGVTGLGDFGTGPEGLLDRAEPELLWRALLVALGLVGYLLTVRRMLRGMDALMGGSGVERVRRAQRVSLTSYLAGGLISVLIGLLNPHGLEIILTSAAAASLGGTSGLAWGMQYLNRRRDTGQPPVPLLRSWPWIVSGVVVIAVYGLLLGPSIRPG